MWRQRAGAFLVALVCGTGVGALAVAGPAMAGNWAVTVLDPLSGPVRSGQAYEVTFWVLQHGTHPYSWTSPSSIGKVGLTLVHPGGERVTFPGRELAEPAHYATTVTVPRDGSWRLVGVQGVFMSYHVGTLTVPGTLTALGVPAAPSESDMAKYWPGKVRPPVLPVNQNRDPFEQAPPDTAAAPAVEPPAQAAAEPAANPADVDNAATNSPPGDSRRQLAAIAVAVAVLLLALGAGGRRWLRGRAVGRSGVARAG